MSKTKKNDLLKLFKEFGNTRRQLYNIKNKNNFSKTEILRKFQNKNLNSKYIKTAYYTIEGLKSGYTFGGKNNKKKLDNHIINKEEWEKYRNNIIASYGEASKKGNPCIRVVDDKNILINIPGKGFVSYNAFLPNRYWINYGKYLDGSLPYTVKLNRKKNDIRLTIQFYLKTHLEGERYIAFDFNVNHIDFAVVDNDKCLVLGSAEYNHKNLDNKIKKFINLSKHYKANVVVGKLNVHKSKNKRCFFSQLPHTQFREKMKKRCLENNIGCTVEFESYTSKLSKKLIEKGLDHDSHQLAAYCFAMKVNGHDIKDYVEVLNDNDDGSLVNTSDNQCRKAHILMPDKDGIFSMFKENLRNINFINIA